MTKMFEIGFWSHKFHALSENFKVQLELQGKGSRVKVSENTHEKKVNEKMFLFTLVI